MDLESELCPPHSNWTLCYDMLPATLLWDVPLANQREPRTFGKFTNLHDELTIDTAIGGQFGLFRWFPPERPDEGLQMDVFAAVFTRFAANEWMLTASDFRAGAPLSCARGPWQARIAYEHTSTHLGDEFIEATQQKKISYNRDEIVLGLARRFGEHLRLYGQFGAAFLSTSGDVANNRTRYQWGVEWSRHRTTSPLGQPFAAFDMDLYAAQQFTPNITVQAGWQWRHLERGRSGRLAGEYYNGRSPYGQFFQEDENWIAFSMLYDW